MHNIETSKKQTHMPNSEGNKQFITDFIQKMMVVLGPNIALDEAKKVDGLKLGPDGSVLEMRGDGLMLVKALRKNFVELIGPVTQMALEPILAKYPDIKI